MIWLVFSVLLFSCGPLRVYLRMRSPSVRLFGSRRRWF